MELGIIFISGILSAYLLDLMPVIKNTRLIFDLQRKSISVMGRHYISDEVKQKLLLRNSAKLLLITFKMVVFFGISLIPFANLVLFGYSLFNIHFSEIIVSSIGLIFSLLAYICFFFCKNIYAKFRL